MMRFLNLKVFFFVPSLIVAFALSNAALADDHASGSWFTEGRYQKSLNEKTAWSDDDTTSTRLASTTGEAWNNLDSIGLAAGYQFSSGLSAFSLGYEGFGTSNLSFATATLANGTALSNLKIPADVTNIILEYSHNMPITDSLFGVAVIGLGMATIETQKYSVTGASNLGQGQKVTNTSTRYGLGLGYKLTDNIQLLSVIQQSDYGKLKVIGTVASGSSLVTSKVASTEASLRLRYSF